MVRDTSDMTQRNDTVQVPEGREAEFDGIVDLLMANAASADDETRAVAERVAAGCLRPGHLWREMELGSRVELRELLESRFPQFAEGNDRDMRWKRYVYRRLCGWPGFQG